MAGTCKQGLSLVHSSERAWRFDAMGCSRTRAKSDLLDSKLLIEFNPVGVDTKARDVEPSPFYSWRAARYTSLSVMIRSVVA